MACGIRAPPINATMCRSISPTTSPGSTRWALTLRAAFAHGLPFGPPHSTRGEQTFRAPAYKRVDVGLNYHLFKAELKKGRRPVVGWGKYVRDAWLGIDCFNLLGIRNVNSYYWITDIEGNRMVCLTI